MCGRYVLNAPEDLSERFQLRQLNIALPHSYNVAPTDLMPIVVERTDGVREAVTMKWGLMPRWAKPGDKKAVAPINARGETLAEKPMFRGLVKNHRCLVPANGFYEWKKMGDYKQPYFVSLPNEPLFAFGGLYDERIDESGETSGTYTIITTSPNEKMASIHNRMPLIISQEHLDEWLDPEVEDATQIDRLIQPYPADEMTVVPVGRSVGSVRNNGPELLEPIELQGF